MRPFSQIAHQRAKNEVQADERVSTRAKCRANTGAQEPGISNAKGGKPLSEDLIAQCEHCGIAHCPSAPAGMGLRRGACHMLRVRASVSVCVYVCVCVCVCVCPDLLVLDRFKALILFKVSMYSAQMHILHLADTKMLTWFDSFWTKKEEHSTQRANVL